MILKSNLRTIICLGPHQKLRRSKEGKEKHCDEPDDTRDINRTSHSDFSFESFAVNPGKDVLPVNRDHYVRDRLWIGDNLI
jgi:hypothetical protein